MDFSETAVNGDICSVRTAEIKMHWIWMKLAETHLFYQSRCKWRFLDNTDRTSAVNRSASKTGSRLSNATSVGSENHDFIGIALSAKKPHLSILCASNNFQNFYYHVWTGRTPLTGISAVSPGTVVQYKNTGEIVANGPQIFRVRTEIWGAVLPVEPPLQDPSAGVQFVRYGCAVDLHAGRKNHQLVPLRNLRFSFRKLQFRRGFDELTMSRKKSTCGLLWTKNRTGCRSITTLSTKSGGVPGLTVCLTTPSWCECIKVSSKSRTRTFLFTIPKHKVSISQRHNWRVFHYCNYAMTQTIQKTTCTIAKVGENYGCQNELNEHVLVPKSQTWHSCKFIYSEPLGFQR